jgi:hypothetical protein
MRIPDRLIRAGQRLSVDEFGEEFVHAWRRRNHRFLKLECWQTYQEPGTRSLRAFLTGDHAQVERLLQAEADEDSFVYEEVARRKVDYARIRLVRLPLTPYLQWEMWNYQIRAKMGEHIQLVEMPPEVELPNDECFDFLLFDRSVALVHDYGDDGLQVGGWLVDDHRTLAELEHRALTLRSGAVPLAAWQGTTVKAVRSASAS